MNDNQAVFSTIYSDHTWGSCSKSGPGSEPSATAQYRAVLEKTLRKCEAKSVVDIGCGDWSFSRLVDWSSVDYTGIDVVPQLISQLQSEYGNDRRRFISADIAKDEFPRADFCVIKDVLQHLPTATARHFLDNILPRYKFALITNDARKTHPAPSYLWPWRRKDIGVANSDIQAGQSRPLRLTQPPFGLTAKRLAWLRVEQGLSRWEKEVLFWEAP